MSNKYMPLTQHLATLNGQSWSTTFDQIEHVLGCPLPESARSYQAWWSNQMRSQSLSWQLAGWKTTALDLENERVTFVYVGGDEEEGESDSPLPIPARPLTIGEAKAGLAVNFGVDPSQIDITIRA